MHAYILRSETTLLVTGHFIENNECILTARSVPPEPQYSAFLNLPAEIRNMVYMYTYGDFGVIAEARDDLARPEILIEIDDDDADADKGELVKFRSPHRITGLHDTCRQIRQETEDFNPLWKVINGTSGSLLRVFDQPNPFEYLRIVTIYLGLGDTVFERRHFDLSENLACLVCYLVCLRYLKEVRVYGCISFFELEEKAAFFKIWMLLRMGTWFDQDFRINCHSSRQFG